MLRPLLFVATLGLIAASCASASNQGSVAVPSSPTVVGNLEQRTTTNGEPTSPNTDSNSTTSSGPPIIGPTTTSAAPATIQAVVESTETDDLTASFRGQLPEGGSILVPDGPYADGQVVGLLASDTQRIDLFNSTPRLCARIGDDDEFCDPSLLHSRPMRQAPAGTQGVTFELPQRHFGPAGYSDCYDPGVECRLLWQTESGENLTGDAIAYDTELPQLGVVLRAESGSEPGVLHVQVAGLDTGATPADMYSARELNQIQASIEMEAEFDLDKLSLIWSVGLICSFGQGDLPTGSQALADRPSWWFFTTLEPQLDGASRKFLGSNCDWDAIDGNLDSIDPNTPTVFRVRRDIYGYGGWVDCALEKCYLELGLQWTYPMDGYTVGGDSAVARVVIDVPESWPSSRPQITIAEPGPYRAGQEVTVEVRDSYSDQSRIAIGWCVGGDVPCSYSVASFEDGVHRVVWKINNTGSGCQDNRCYFAVGSRSEGMAPSTILIVNLVE